MKLNYDALAPHLRQHLLPVYLVSGDEPLLVAEAADAIRARARAAGISERETCFIERAADWADVRASASNLSLFADRRLVEIRLSSAKPGAAGGAALKALVESEDPGRLLLIITPRLDRDAQGAEWVHAVAHRGGWVQVWPVDPPNLLGWLRKRSAGIGLTVPDDALQIIAERTEGNLLAANQELQKLRLATSGTNVTTEDALASVADSARFDVFQLGEAVLRGELARALRMLSGLRGEGVEPTLVLWALNRAARDIWNAASGGDARSRAWGRQAAALDAAAKRFPQLRFARISARATRADRIIKGRILLGNAWDELALLAAELCGAPIVPLSRLEMAGV